jgi:3-methyladenine DNA glycosylase/8-oxoguanine DNA glycosylase
MPGTRSRVKSASKELDDACSFLSKKDRALNRVISTVGPCGLKIDLMQSPFEALAEAIVYQQLSGKAAATIFGRVKALFGEKKLLEPEDILLSSEEALRAAGCSRAKAVALIDLAVKTKEGLVPALEEMHGMSDDQLIERLVAVRGVGRWTVEMLLIFRLGRLDVLPATDYGIRKGFAITYKLADLPTPKEILTYGEKWKPFRSVASWYLWRANEL